MKCFAIGVFLLAAWVTQIDAQAPKLGDVRLDLGPDKGEGIAMMYNGAAWGTVCDQKGFNETGWASVLCQQLGYDKAESIEFVRDRPNGAALLANVANLPLAFQKPNCRPRQRVSFSQCAHNQVNNEDDDECQKGHEQDCWVKCNGPAEGDLRLVDGNNTEALAGRAEMFQDGAWGTICDTRGFSVNGWPAVFCKQYLGDDDAVAVEVRRVTGGERVPLSTPIAKEIPNCSPKDTTSFQECRKNDKKNLDGCGRIRNNVLKYKGHDWDMYVKCEGGE